MIYIIIALQTLFLPMLLWFIFAIFTYTRIPENYEKTRNFFIIFSVAVLCLIPTYDIIIVKTLGAFYHYTLPKPFLNEKFEKQISLYVEDNVMPFKQDDLKSVGRNYLFSYLIDDINITKVGLNGKDDFIYIYYIDTKSEKYQQFLELKNKIKKIETNVENSKKYLDDKAQGFNASYDYYLDETTRELYKKMISEKYNLSKEILKTDKIAKDKLSGFDYTLKIEALKLNDFVSKNIFVMTKDIVNNKTLEQIGHDHIIGSVVKYNISPGPGSNVIYENEITNEIFLDFRRFSF